MNIRKMISGYKTRIMHEKRIYEDITSIFTDKMFVSKYMGSIRKTDEYRKLLEYKSDSPRHVIIDLHRLLYNDVCNVMNDIETLTFNMYNILSAVLNDDIVTDVSVIYRNNDYTFAHTPVDLLPINRFADFGSSGIHLLLDHDVIHVRLKCRKIGETEITNI